MRSDENHVLPRAEVPRGDEMRTLDEVAAMLRLKALGWGIKRIARELGCSHMTVRRYVNSIPQGGERAHFMRTGLWDVRTVSAEPRPEKWQKPCQRARLAVLSAGFPRRGRAHRGVTDAVS